MLSALSHWLLFIIRSLMSATPSHATFDSPRLHVSRFYPNSVQLPCVPSVVVPNAHHWLLNRSNYVTLNLPSNHQPWLLLVWRHLNHHHVYHVSRLRGPCELSSNTTLVAACVILGDSRVYQTIFDATKVLLPCAPFG